MKRYRRYTFLTWRDIALLLLMGATFIGACSVVAWMDKPVEVEEEPVFEAVELVEEVVVEEPEEPELVSLGEFKITHYCPCSKCCGKWADGITSTGTTAVEGRTIAVDPSVIPYGSEVIIAYENGVEASYIAEDCGGSIKGNRIDVFMDSHQAALIEGVKYGEVFVKAV